MIIQGDNISQADFILQVLERDIRNIYRAQHLIVSQRIWMEGKELKAKKRQTGVNRNTGNLEESLASPDFYMKAEGETFTVAANYPIYIRFLDMKHIRDMRLYNRQIWGVLYNNALKDIRYKYGEVISDRVGNALKEIFPSSSFKLSPSDKSVARDKQNKESYKPRF